MKVKKRFKRIIGKIAKKILEILIYFDQKRIGKCDIILDKGKMTLNIYVTQKGLYRGSGKYYNNKILVIPNVYNVKVNYILDGLNINKRLKITNYSNSNIIIRNSNINAPIEFWCYKVELENNNYTNEDIRDYTGTSLGGTVTNIKLKDENINNQRLVFSFKSEKIEMENSNLNLYDIKLDSKYFIVKNCDIKSNKFDISNNGVSYFNNSKIHSNLIEIITKKFINKKSKIQTFALKYNGKVYNIGELLKLDTESLDSEKNLRSTLTTELIKLKENLKNSKKQILKKVCNDLEERKVKKYLKK